MEHSNVGGEYFDGTGFLYDEEGEEEQEEELFEEDKE